MHATYLLHKGDIDNNLDLQLELQFHQLLHLLLVVQLLQPIRKKDLSLNHFTSRIHRDFVKAFSIRSIPVESITGSFSAGDKVSKGTSPNRILLAVVYGVDATLLHIGLLHLMELVMRIRCW